MVLGCVFLLQGCAQPAQPVVHQWAKSGGTEDQFLKDRYACLLASRTDVSSTVIDGALGESHSGQVFSASVFVSCMEAQGYTEASTGFAPPPGTGVAMQ